MLEEELYEPMRRWLEQYMKDHYEGGGHKGAAGGKLNIEQFNRLITECKI